MSKSCHLSTMILLAPGIVLALATAMWHHDRVGSLDSRRFAGEIATEIVTIVDVDAVPDHGVGLSEIEYWAEYHDLRVTAIIGYVGGFLLLLIGAGITGKLESKRNAANWVAWSHHSVSLDRAVPAVK